MLKLVSDIKVGDVIVVNSDYSDANNEVKEIKFLDMDMERMEIVFTDGFPIRVSANAIVQVAE